MSLAAPEMPCSVRAQFQKLRWQDQSLGSQRYSEYLWGLGTQEASGHHVDHATCDDGSKTFYFSILCFLQNNSHTVKISLCELTFQNPKRQNKNVGQQFTAMRHPGANCFLSQKAI